MSWWAKIVVKALITLLQPLLDKAVGPELEAIVINIIKHITGADNQVAAVMKVREVHECNGIGCAVDTKKD